MQKSKEIIRAIKFAIISISAGIIQFGSFALLNEVFKLPYWPSYLISLILSIVWNFTINRKITFKSANNVPIAMLKVLGYYAVFTPLSTWWGNELTSHNWNEYLVLGGTMIINFVTEFLFDRYFVFGKSIDTANKNKSLS
jgi:putative flippase GtrA